MQVELLPHTSVAVTVTAVVPTAKNDPDAGLYEIATAPAQLSVAVAVNETFDPQRPGVLFTVMLAGQVTTGAVLSFTVIVCVQVTKLPEASVALYVRMIV